MLSRNIFVALRKALRLRVRGSRAAGFHSVLISIAMKSTIQKYEIVFTVCHIKAFTFASIFHTCLAT